ncbi:MAG TPA: DUF2993 domain-containing protein [Cyanothece sp. UBA12306]|nr:DUF2993 domain-containing protein [Cyanothece sp. UBA12306]
MEFFTIFLSSLLTVISPVGLVIDTVVANTIRSQVKSVEELAVRIDNTPSYQPIQGKIDRVRIATRGIEPLENLRIEAIELETDPIDLNINGLEGKGLTGIRKSLRQPLQLGVNLIIKEDDINQALESANIKSKIQQVINNVLPAQAPRFSILTLQFQFKSENRLGIEVKLQQDPKEGETPEPLALTLETGLKVKNGRSLQLLDLNGTLNGRKLSRKFLSRFQSVDLDILEKQGIVFRLLQLNVDEETLNASAFFRLDTLQSDSGS